MTLLKGLLILCLLTPSSYASELASQILAWEQQIQQTQDPQRRARMIKSFEQRMTPRFEQHLQNARNNLHRSLSRIQKALLSGKSAIAHLEAQTFKKHLQRFEQLARAGGKLSKYANSQFQVKIVKNKVGASGAYRLQVTPKTTTASQVKTAVQSNVKNFISKLGFLTNPKAFNSDIRVPSNSPSKPNKGSQPALRNIEDVAPPKAVSW